LGGRGAGVRPLFEGSAVLLRGCGASAVRWSVAQCHGADTVLTAQCRIVAGMASLGGLAEQSRDMIPKRVKGMTCRGFVFDLCVYMCQNIKCSGRGSRYGGGEPVSASSEAETRSRGRPALEQDRTHPRGRPALKRGGTSPEGTSSPRRGRISIVWSCAKRSFARGWLGLTVLVGHWGSQDRGPLLLGCGCLRCVLHL
jgi:hypothetical protein